MAVQFGIQLIRLLNDQRAWVEISRTVSLLDNSVLRCFEKEQQQHFFPAPSTLLLGHYSLLGGGGGKVDTGQGG